MNNGKPLNPECPCLKISCPRHGNCDECRRNHYDKGGLPTCKK